MTPEFVLNANVCYAIEEKKNEITNNMIRATPRQNGICEVSQS
jgi:hypothetical protein